jgi:regulatory protein
MKITAINPHKKKENEVVIYIDGKRLCSVGQDVLVNSGVALGQEINDIQCEELMRLGEYTRALSYAQLLLTYRKRTKKEMAIKLKSKEYSETLIENVLEQLVSLGYINDKEFALWWINQRRRSNPKGNAAISYELRKKGVAEETINAALSEADLDSKENEYELAQIASSSAIEKYRQLDPSTARRRLISFLKRRGFSWDVVNDIVNSMFDN